MDQDFNEIFKLDGIVHVKNLFSEDKIDSAVDAIERFKRNNLEFLKSSDLFVEEDRLHRVINLHLHLQELKDLFVESAEKISDVVDSLGKATLYTSIFFERGSQQPLHRDTPYFYTGKKIPDYMGFWAALEDVDESNGPLIAMKKSHILGEADLIALRNQYFKSQNVPPSHDGLFNSYNSECLKMAESMGLVAEQFPMKKGDVIIWNASTLHGGAPQLDLSKTRKSFVMHITPKNTPVKHMDYFFQQDKQNIPKAEWNYLNYREREFVNTNVVDFMHKKQVKVKDLV